MRTECQCWSSRRLPRVTDVWLLLKCRLESPEGAETGRRHQSYQQALNWSMGTQGEYRTVLLDANGSSTHQKHTLVKTCFRFFEPLIHMHMYTHMNTCTFFFPWNTCDELRGFPDAAPHIAVCRGWLLCLCPWFYYSFEAQFVFQQQPSDCTNISCLFTHINRPLLTLLFQLCDFCIFTRKMDLSIFKEKKPQVSEATWIQVLCLAQIDF